MTYLYADEALARLSPAFVVRFQALMERLKYDYPERELPIFTLSNHPQQRAGAWMMGNHIVMGSHLPSQLTVDELYAVVAHELGHYYLHDSKPISQGQLSKEAAAKRQGKECQADHFAYRYGAHPEHQLSALRKIAGGDQAAYYADQQIALMEQHGHFIQHPRTQSRADLLAEKEFLQRYRPEEVEYGMQCQVLGVSALPPVLPRSQRVNGR